LNIWKYMKSNKVFFLLSLAAAILGTVVSLFIGGCTKKNGNKEKILASKRVKVDLKEPALPGTKKAPGNELVVEEKGKAAGRAVVEREKKIAGMAGREEGKRPRKAVSRPLRKTRTHRAGKASGAVVKTIRPWAVNVASFTHGDDAAKLRDLLLSIGYNAYMTKFVKDGTLFYRIRVGFYSTRAEASQVGRKIAARYRYVGTPWVVKPGRDEVVSHSK